MTDRQTDLAIVGGGPAGLAAGIRARQHDLAATVWEPRPTPADKACGEGLMPAALETLRELGVARSDLRGIPLEGVRYRDAADADTAAEGLFSGSDGLGVRRLELHRTLRQLAERAGVRFRERRVDSVEIGEEFVRVDDETARVAVAADGLHSDLRNRAGLDRPAAGPSRYGVRRHYRTEPWTSFVEVHWSRRGEAYVTPVAPDRVGVAILAEEGGRFDELVDAFPDLQRRLADADQTSTDRGAGPFRQRASSVRSGRLLLAGDAAGYVDALTGEGVALAVETGRAAADAVAADNLARYPRDWRRITRPYRWLTGLAVELTRHRFLHRPLIELLDRWPALFDGALELLGGATQPSAGRAGLQLHPW